MEKKKNNGVLIGLLIGIITMILIFSILYITKTISFTSNKENARENNITRENNIINNTKQITGNYEFYEFAEPNQNMSYTLQISNDNTATLNIDGFQTMIRIKAKVEQNGNNWNIIYEESLNNQNELYKKGEILFTLYNENEKLYTKWEKLQPMLEKNKEVGIYFKLKDNTTENTNTSNQENTNTTQKKNNREELIAKLKEKLTDENWIKENLYSKKNCFGQEVNNSNQELTFEVLEDNEKNPIVIVSNYSFENFIVACYKVYVKNNEVIAKNINDSIGHPSHIGFSIDKNQGLVIANWAHMGNYIFTAYDIKNDEIKVYDKYECNTGQCEYVYKGEKSYNISEFSKELNKDNINTYLK